MSKIIEDIENFRQEVKTDISSKSWKEIISDFTVGDLLINPDFQRLFRWDLDQQSLFIESVLLGIPIPPLFLAENENGKFDLIDGLQRVSSVLKLFSPERLSIEPYEISNAVAEASQNDINLPTLIRAGAIVESLEGYDVIPPIRAA